MTVSNLLDSPKTLVEFSTEQPTRAATTSVWGMKVAALSSACLLAFGPFVNSLPSAGKVEVEVGILGSGLTGATGVTFNGTPARFSVHLPSLILTHVPTGATTGKIAVTLPGQTLSRNASFYVIP